MTSKYEEHFMKNLIAEAKEKVQFEQVAVFGRFFEQNTEEESIFCFDLDGAKYGKEAYLSVREKIRGTGRPTLFISERKHYF